MTRLLLIVSFWLYTVINLSAQLSKINPQGLTRIFQYQNENIVSRSNNNVRDSIFITLNKGYSINAIEKDGAEELLQLSPNVYIVSVPLDQIEEIAQNEAVKKITFPKIARPLLNKAREYCKVDLVQAGTDLNQAYDGTGVLTGIYDTGIDPNSPVFRTFPDNVSRVKAFYNGSTVYETDDLASVTTDDKNATHGTHCASIMAGAATMPRYSITNSGVAEVNSNNAVSIKPLTSGYPYGGVAPGASIYLAGGNLTTTQAVMACQKIVDYAKSAGMPAVINMSLGISTGPHDGSTEFNQAIEEMTKDAVFCISAGNNGDENCSVEKTFTSSDNSLKTFIVNQASSKLPSVNTYAEFWANNSDSLKIEFSLFDRSTNQIIDSYSLGSSLYKNIVTSDKTASGNNVVSSSTLSRYFTNSFVELFGELQSNNRFMVYIYLDLTPSTNNNNTILPVVTITGKSGQYVYGNLDNASSYEFSSMMLAGYTDGNADVSINDWACSPSVISVGAFATRNYFPTLNKQYLGWPTIEIGNIASFSSYGTTFDGRQLPVVAAPGQTTIAALSSHYTDANNYTTDSQAASAWIKFNARNYYWQQMQGSSMASPFVAGTVALWLQANPSLTSADVMDIIKNTSTKNDYYNNEPYKWGYGAIDSYAGLKMALDKSGVVDIQQDPELNLVVRSIDGRSFDVFVKDTPQMEISLYSITGTCITHQIYNGENATVTVPGNQSGIVIMRIVTPNATYSRKIVVQ